MCIYVCVFIGVDITIPVGGRFKLCLSDAHQSIRAGYISVYTFNEDIVHDTVTDVALQINVYGNALSIGLRIQLFNGGDVDCSGSNNDPSETDTHTPYLDDTIAGVVSTDKTTVTFTTTFNEAGIYTVCAGHINNGKYTYIHRINVSML